MKRGHFQAQLNQCCRVCQSLDLVQRRVESPKYVAGLRATLADLTYLEMWKKLTADDLYDLQFQDLSLLQFRYVNDNPFVVSFAYYPCPLNVLSFREFVHSDVYVRYNEYGTAAEQYDEYVSAAELKTHVLPIRYDSDPRSYECAKHPASHVHMGLENDVRLSTRRYWRPLTFTLLVLRQVYPHLWIRLLNSGRPPSFFANVKEALPEVESACWQVKDGYEVALH